MANMYRWLLVWTLFTLSLGASIIGERALTALSSPALSDLANMRDPSKNLDVSDPHSHLQKILIPRTRTHILSVADWSCRLTCHIADTENHTLVRNYIVSTLRKLKWHIEEDTFVDSTPYGPKNFTNVIATKDPDAPRRVVLAAHYDSKYFSSYPSNQVRHTAFFIVRRSPSPTDLRSSLSAQLIPPHRVP